MSLIKSRRLYLEGSSTNVVDWVKGAEFRFYDSLTTEEQLEKAKVIAAIANEDARKLALELLNTAGSLRRQLVKAKKEFETLHETLSNFDAELDAQEAERAKKQKAVAK